MIQFPSSFSNAQTICFPPQVWDQPALRVSIPFKPVGKQKATIIILDSDEENEKNRISQQGNQKSTAVTMLRSPSLIKQERPQYSVEDFKFLEIPVVTLTEDFFNDPFKLIDDLYAKNYHKVGVVKLVPPSGSLKENSQIFSEMSKKLRGKRLLTRKQNLNHLKQGKPFLHNAEGYTVNQYVEMSKKFEQEYKIQTLRTVNDEIKQNEIDFWSIVDNPQDYEPVEVEYAADLLVSKYASGFLEQETNGLNLNKINKVKNSIFQILTEQTEMSGISIPWLYFGMYAIPPSNAQKFDEIFNETYSERLKTNPKLLHDIVCQISPVELAKRKVKVLRGVQQPGEFILTMGQTYHAGFSNGLNCSEAVNIAPIQWLDEYEKAIEQYRKSGSFKKVSFPLEWLLFKIVKQIDDVLFSNEQLKKIAQKLHQIIEKEVMFRKSIVVLYPDIELINFKNSEDKYDKHVCKICTDYTYLSYLQ